LRGRNVRTGPRASVVTIQAVCENATLRLAPGRRKLTVCADGKKGGARSMIQDAPRRGWQCAPFAQRSRPRRTRSTRTRGALLFEPLEGRQLLSFFTGPSAIRPVLSHGGAFLIQVQGPGLVKVHPAGRGAIDVIAFGTNASSTITITQVRPPLH